MDALHTIVGRYQSYILASKAYTSPPRLCGRLRCATCPEALCIGAANQRLSSRLMD